MNERSSGSPARRVQRVQGVGPARTGPHLAQHAGELLRQRPRHHGDGAGQRLLEAEAGLHADGQEVEHVGELPPHGQLALGHHPIEPGVGPESPGHADEHDHGQQGLARQRRHRAHDQPQHGDGHQRQHAHHEELVDLLGRAPPREHQLVSQLVDVVGGKEPLEQPHQEGGGGREDALGEGLSQVLLALDGGRLVVAQPDARRRAR